MRVKNRGQRRGKKLILQPRRLFALRLAKACGRLDDAGSLAELSAFDLLEGVDDSHRWERLESILATGFATLATLLCAEDGPAPADFLPPPRLKIVRGETAKPAGASVALQKAVISQIVALHNLGAR